MATASESRRKRLTDDYFQMVAEFPLTRIESTQHLAEAIERIDQLLARGKLTRSGQVYLDVLTDLVEAYESEHERIPDVSESDVLRLLMETHALSQPKLAVESGISQSTISAILSGKRLITRTHAIRLGRVFHVSPAVFMPAE